MISVDKATFEAALAGLKAGQLGIEDLTAQFGADICLDWSFISSDGLKLKPDGGMHVSSSYCGGETRSWKVGDPLPKCAQGLFAPRVAGLVRTYILGVTPEETGQFPVVNVHEIVTAAEYNSAGRTIPPRPHLDLAEWVAFGTTQCGWCGNIFEPAEGTAWTCAWCGAT